MSYANKIAARNRAEVLTGGIMPPKAKFTEQEVIEKAFDIVRNEGADALTARSLAVALNSSPRPIFTVFRNMEEVWAGVMRRAKDCYNAYIAKAFEETYPFRAVGRQYILFAVEEGNLFRLLFMKERGAVKNLATVLPEIDENYDKILASVQNEYGLNEEDARRFYRHLWTYSHGIATMTVTELCRFTPEEIAKMSADVAKSLIIYLRSENRD